MTTITSKATKEFALELGADSCGIADIHSFIDALEGFSPADVYSDCKSVIVFIKQMPTDVMFSENPIPYTHAAYKMYEELDKIGMELCRFFQKGNVKAVIVPADVPYLSWDSENMHGKGIISLKHFAVLAGMGIMGNRKATFLACSGYIFYRTNCKRISYHQTVSVYLIC